MQTNIQASGFSHLSLRTYALVAGLGLLLMAILAPIANFGVMEALVVPGDAATTTNNIAASSGLFRTGILLFLVVVVLDVIVAWALYGLLHPVNQSLSLLAAWFRVVYATILAVALGNYLNVLQLVSRDYLQIFGSGQLQAQVQLSLNAFTDLWNLGLAIFGLHLLLVGYLAFRSGFIPIFLGVLVFIAGLGYTIDGMGGIISQDYSLSLAMFTFVGEVLLIFWCLWKGFKGFELDTE
ncbi:MAG: DUF4386 domain-containing protein [Candidatus Marinimicrobia bacterium]|nr:DUF4386 domain-containing protein [Candidatus Neomarinimicrobiota bacterium]MCF7921772.1 DUF4386 domain-containing protein [Candidatus Neomarinimicrobiota bacterium]